RRRLEEHEKKIEEYRRRYLGELPSQLDSNLQAVKNAQVEIQGLDESINRDRDRRLLLERQLADMSAPANTVNTATDSARGTDPTSIRGASTVDQLLAGREMLRAM